MLVLNLKSVSLCKLKPLQKKAPDLACTDVSPYRAQPDRGEWSLLREYALLYVLISKQGIVSTLVIVQKSLSRYLYDAGDAPSIRSAPGSRTASTPVLDSIFSMAGNMTAPSLIATTLPHASAHVLVDTLRDASEGQPVDVRLHDRSSA